MDLISGIALGNAAIAGVGAYGAKKASSSPNDERLQATIEQLQREIEVLKKAKEICESKSALPVPEPVPEPAPIPEAVPEPPAPEPAPIPEAVPEPAPEPEAEQREVKQEEIDQCKQKLDSLGITDLPSYRKWMLRNRYDPDIANVNNCADLILKGKKGGLRKKKLRSRRGGKQKKNVRRTRRS